MATTESVVQEDAAMDLDGSSVNADANNDVVIEDNTNDNDNDDKNDQNEVKEDPNASKINIIMDIPRIQWFIIKNNERKQIASDNVQIVTHPKKDDILVFTFPTNPSLSYVLCKEYPCLKMQENNYIFVTAHDSFGLFIDPTNSIEIIEKFEEIVKQYSHLRISQRGQAIHQLAHNDDLYAGPPDKIAMAGDRLAELIRKGTVVVSRGIRNSTVSAATGLHKGKERLKTRLTPREEPAVISPSTQSRLLKARMGAQALVKVSGAILTGTMAAANVLSNEISDAVSQTELGKRMSENNGPKTKAAKDLLKSSISGVVTVYDEVINAGLHLVRETGNATADVVGHKYGNEAKEAAQSTSDIVDSAARSVVNINALGVKSLAKRVTANTTVDLLSDENEKKENRDTRINIDPMTGMQVLMTANQISNIKDKKSDEKRKKRQDYVGLEPWDPNNVNNINNNDVNVVNGVNDVQNEINGMGDVNDMNGMSEINLMNGGDNDDVMVENDIVMHNSNINNNINNVNEDVNMNGSINMISNVNVNNNINEVANDNSNNNNNIVKQDESNQVDSIFEQDVFDVD